VWQGILSPILFGWPNERPRYFALARRRKGREGGREGGAEEGGGGGGDSVGAEEEELIGDISPVWQEKALPPFLVSALSSSPSPSLPPSSLKENETRIREYLERDPGREGLWSTYAVPPSLLAKSSAWCFDIVSPASRR